MRLALMLTIASLLHPALVWITARRKGAKEPGNGLIKRYVCMILRPSLSSPWKACSQVFRLWLAERALVPFLSD